MVPPPPSRDKRENIMSKFETIKRATVGNLIKSDAAGDNTWIVGRILASDTKKGTITYAPADGTEDIVVKREHAYKATKAEYDAQLPDAPAAKPKDKPAVKKERDTEEVLINDIDQVDLDDLDDEEEKPLSRVKDYIDKYDVVIAASGKKSRDAGDKVAKELRGMTLADVYKRASSILDVSEEKLMAKYTHLNEGQQRMCLGNRIRGHYRRAAKEADEA